MPRVVPSQVVDFIDKLFPNAAVEQPNNVPELTFTDLEKVAALIDLVTEVPAELLIMNATQYTEYVASVAAVKSRIRVWETKGNTQPIRLIAGLRTHGPVALIRQALTKCPDNFPAAGTTELNFMTDAPLRESLRLDISTISNTLANGEWKAATVVAGSVIEALLLWTLQQQDSDEVFTAAKNLNIGESKLEKWGLGECIKVAAQMKLITEPSAKACTLAQNFRNLIHPGRTQRLQQVCNRATALSATAAVEHVVTDLAGDRKTQHK